MNFDSWIRQPTNIHAFGVIAAGAGAALAQVATGNHTLDIVVGVIAYVLTHLGIDDNSAPEASSKRIAEALTHGREPTKDDVLTVLRSFTPPEVEEKPKVSLPTRPVVVTDPKAPPPAA
jgi:hypothetical protein